MFGRSGDDGESEGEPPRGADRTAWALSRAGLSAADGWTVQIAAQLKESQLERLGTLELGRDRPARPWQDAGWRVFAERLAADRAAARLAEQLFAMLVEAVPRTAAESAARLARPRPAAEAAGSQQDPVAEVDGRPILVAEGNTTAAVNTVWIAARLAQDDSGMVAALGALLRRVLTEPWSIESVRLRNACINALAELATDEAAEQLSALAPLAPAKAQRSQILLAVQLAARNRGGVPSRLAELAVARHGLGGDWHLAVSVHHRSYTLELLPSGRVKVSEFADATPATEDEHALKVVNRHVRDIEETYAHEVIRLEELLSAQRTWPYADWRNLYLAHPITRAVTCRLVWRLHLPDGRRIEVIPDHVGGLCAMGGRLAGGKKTAGTVAAGVAAILQDATMVELWHPRAATDRSVGRWRALLPGLWPGQPFPQIEREYTRRLPAPDETELIDYADRAVPSDVFDAAVAALRWKPAGARGVSDAVPADAKPAAVRDREAPGREPDHHDRGGDHARDGGGSTSGTSGTNLVFHEFSDAGLACVLRISRPQPDTVLTGPAWFARIGDKKREPVPLDAPGELVISEALRALARLAGTRLSDGDILDSVPGPEPEDTIADEPWPEVEELEDAAPDGGGATDWNRVV
ncbi:MAG TPA: DUF4132 domain-containing protein [Actinocrinis sp.]